MYSEILELIELGKEFQRRNWVPATSGNLSVKLSEKTICITASGAHKGYLTKDDFILIDIDGNLLEGCKKPSAETLLHLTVYKTLPEVKSVLHVHSPNSTVISMLKNKQIRLEGYEILKAFSGINTHDTFIEVPIFENSQNMNELSELIKDYLTKRKAYGFLLKAHGIYTWGKSIREAAINLEAFDFLFDCELKLQKGGLQS